MDINEQRSYGPFEANSTLSYINTHEKLSAFIIATFFMFCAQRYINFPQLNGDAFIYWDLSSSIWNFSFPQTIRGYFYPLLLSPAKFIFETFPGTGYLALHLMQALAFSFSLTLLLPYIFTRLIGGRVSLVKRLIVPLLVAIFFPTLIAYTLSDLPALCLILACLATILFASERNSFMESGLLIFLAGIMAYGAYNTRTIYLFTMLLLTLLIPTLVFRGAPLSKRIMLAIAFILGAGLTAIPQALINVKHLGSATPMVVTDVRNASLFARQLKWGITIQRYETGYDVKSGAIFPIFHLDPAGEELFKRLDLGNVKTSIQGYFKALISEPFGFLKIYTRHLINGLDVRDDDTYTKVLSKEKNVRSLASLLTSIFGLFCLFYLMVRRSTSGNIPATADKTDFRWVWLFVILLPVMAIIPGAIETRFFVTLHLMAYCAIAYGFPDIPIRSLSTTRKMLLALLYGAIVTACYISAAQSVSTPGQQQIPDDYKR
ncbi:hypothetical protein HX870_02165 [Pseudomonas gingeri]|uniref:hypothetical protein n=1 Tax=Pseudomonas gingeri TaxID=117681 RepID=UPI0015A03FBB|nr:hypothetical protein [Pseudomonas gingeri]NWD66426.1 hypothetical protein [Pseudomonas gingeri]